MKHGLATEALILVPEQKRGLSPNYADSGRRTKSKIISRWTVTVLLYLLGRN